jgi:hypothetical protein
LKLQTEPPQYPNYFADLRGFFAPLKLSKEPGAHTTERGRVGLGQAICPSLGPYCVSDVFCGRNGPDRDFFVFHYDFLMKILPFGNNIIETLIVKKNLPVRELTQRTL